MERNAILTPLRESRKISLYRIHQITGEQAEDGKKVSYYTLQRAFNRSTEIPPETRIKTLTRVAAALDIESGDLLPNTGDAIAREAIAHALVIEDDSIASILFEIERLQQTIDSLVDREVLRETGIPFSE